MKNSLKCLLAKLRAEVVQDSKTMITHEWQVGTKATTDLFENPGITIPDGLTLKEGMRKNLHDIEYDIFKAIQDKMPDEFAQKYSIPDFRSRLDQLAAKTGDLGSQTPNLTEEIAQFHSEASEILKKLYEENGAKFIENFYH